MKRLITLLSLALSLGASRSNAQVFWYENFDNGSNGLAVSNYSSTNGAWALTITGSEDADYNQWYVSCKEAGRVAGGCGGTCAASLGLGSTLHVGSTSLGDMGASYDAGGGVISNTTTDRRAESPVINCTGHTNITIRFYYIENGQGSTDDGSVWYYDGSSWALLVNTAKTTTCGGGQGTWAQYSATLPASADNNPNVKLGFRWVNDNDGAGTDPSFAIDSISLSTTSSVSAPVASYTVTPGTTICQDSCIAATSTTSGTVTSQLWTIAPVTGATIASPSATTTNVCFATAGTYTLTLTASNTAGANASSQIITVNPAPHPFITKTGHVLSVANPSHFTSFQWMKNTVTLTGATNSTYTYSVSASYSVVVDSGGCKGTATLSTLGVPGVNNAGIEYWVSQTDFNYVTVYAAGTLGQSLDVAIYDATGRKVDNEMWQAGSNSKQMNTGSLPPGIYIIRLSNDNTSQVLKFKR